MKIVLISERRHARSADNVVQLFLTFPLLFRVQNHGEDESKERDSGLQIITFHQRIMKSEHEPTVSAPAELRYVNVGMSC